MTALRPPARRAPGLPARPRRARRLRRLLDRDARDVAGRQQRADLPAGRSTRAADRAGRRRHVQRLWRPAHPRLAPGAGGRHRPPARRSSSTSATAVAARSRSSGWSGRRPATPTSSWTRAGRGARWSPGDTPDIEDVPATGQFPGFATRGIDDPRTLLLPAPDHRRRPGVGGRDRAIRSSIPSGSSSPGRARVAGSRWPWPASRRRVRAAAIDVPFMCHWRRAIERHRRRPVSRGHALPRDPARPCRPGLRDPRLRRRPAVRGAGERPGPLLGRAHGRGLPALDGLRGVQPLRRPARHPGLVVQRSRRRPAPPAGASGSPSSRGLGIDPWQGAPAVSRPRRPGR